MISVAPQSATTQLDGWDSLGGNGQLGTASADDLSASYLAAHLRALDARVRSAVARRRAVDPNPDDSFRGLYLSDAQVDDLIARSGQSRLGIGDVIGLDMGIDEAVDVAEAAGAPARLRNVGRRFGLSSLDVWLLLIAVAPDLDPRYESLYGYLHDDVTRRRASVGLGLELCLGTVLSAAARDRFAPNAPLVGGGLLTVEEPDRPFLSRSLRVPDRVTAYILGSDEPDASVAAAFETQPDADLPSAGEVAAVLTVEERALVYIRERAGGAGYALGAHALRMVGRPALALNFERVGADEVRATVTAAIREARLTGSGIVAGDVDQLAETHLGALRVLADAAAPVVLVGRRSWDPVWSLRPAYTIDATSLPDAARAALWIAELGIGTAPENEAAHRAVALDTVGYQLAPGQIARAVRSAQLRAGARAVRAAATGRPSDESAVPTTAEIQAGARAQNSGGLERLARRVEPRATWTDLIVTDDVRAQLREIASRVRLRDQVLSAWGIGGKAGRRQGVAALFAGPSGTGKTMAAEVLAGALGLDLYTIDLATVVDKYIGETEKNLERIFTEAERVNAVVFFDEADALFGKRSEVSDARDRYANIEVAYLLQRIEQFDGIAILATNLRANVDEAFARRLDALIDFPMPEAADRRLLWDRSIGLRMPRDANVDLDFMAERFKLSGGNIRNISVAAAFLSADAERPLHMEALIVATAREYRKLGRLCLEAEFGRYHGLVP